MDHVIIILISMKIRLCLFYVIYSQYFLYVCTEVIMNGNCCVVFICLSSTTSISVLLITFIAITELNTTICTIAVSVSCFLLHMPKAKKLMVVSHGKDFAPSGHHISNIDKKARNSIKVISSLECFPQPCQSFSSFACKCMCISDMIEQHHLQLDDIKFFVLYQKKCGMMRMLLQKAVLPLWIFCVCFHRRCL